MGEPTLNNYEFRLANCDEISEITNIYHSLIGTPGCTWDLDYPSRETAEYDVNNGFLYILKDGEKIIAVASAGNFDELGDLQWKLQNPCELARIGVMPTMQKQGIGSILLKYLIQAMADKGYDGMRFTAYKNNHAALALYDKNGFEKCGEVFRFDRENCCYQMKFKN
jgi:ribosomal protein S18 acetylase RimI-like enzyme